MFLDEIGELKLDLQAKLLSFVEHQIYRRVGSPSERRADVRIILATRCDVLKAEAEGRFRSDLLARLKACPIHLPPLRVRPRDLDRLSRVFLERALAEESVCATGTGFSSSCMAWMRAHSWPTNVRELRDRIRNAVVRRRGGLIEVEDLFHDPLTNRWPAPGNGEPKREAPHLDHPPYITPDGRPLTFDEGNTLQTRFVLQYNSGNVEKSAKDLGISKQGLYNLLARLGIDPAEFRKG